MLGEVLLEVTIWIVSEPHEVTLENRPFSARYATCRSAVMLFDVELFLVFCEL